MDSLGFIEVHYLLFSECSTGDRGISKSPFITVLSLCDFMFSGVSFVKLSALSLDV